MPLEDQFLSLLPWIDRLIADLCHRYCVQGDEMEELASLVKLKLIDDDYAVLRSFQQRSRITTFLTVVIQNLFRDYWIRKWGRWRVSTRAKRQGAVAMQLEILLYRDGFSFHEAARILRRNYGVRASWEELADLAGRLPQRSPRRFEGMEALETRVSEDLPDRRLRDEERSFSAKRAQVVLNRALASLTAEDRLILRMRFREGLSVPDIAAALHLGPRRIHGRLQRRLTDLRATLELAGFTRQEVTDLLEWKEFDIQVVF